MALELKQAGDTIEKTDAELMPEGDKETVYVIRHMTIEKNREFLKKHTKRKPNPRTHYMEDVTDMEALADDQFDYALSDWRGVVATGTLAPIPCTREYKMLLDGQRRDAIMRAAGLNEVIEGGKRARAESFREVADVR